MMIPAATASAVATELATRSDAPALGAAELAELLTTALGATGKRRHTPTDAVLAHRYGLPDAEAAHRILSAGAEILRRTA